MKLQLPSPLQKLSLSPSLEVYIKRDDLIHPWVSGNKYRKLKGYLEGSECKQLITFGGPFSNHLHATAAYCYYHNIHCTAIVRGLDADLENPTLKDVQKWKADIKLVNRSDYKQLKDQFSNDSLEEGVIVIPEGGWGEQGFIGMKELSEELLIQHQDVDVVILPVGTATTMIGLDQYLPDHIELLGIRAVRDDSLKARILKYRKRRENLLRLISGYEWKGFAKYNDELLQYLETKQELGLPLDFVYNAKAFYALEDMIQNGYFKKGANIIYLHTGGLQGNRGLSYKREKKK